MNMQPCEFCKTPAELSRDGKMVSWLHREDCYLIVENNRLEAEEREAKLRVELQVKVRSNGQATR